MPDPTNITQRPVQIIARLFRPWSWRAGILAALLIAGAAGVQAQPTTNLWVGSNALWSAASAWSPANVPNAVDTMVTFNNTSPVNNPAASVTNTVGTLNLTATTAFGLAGNNLVLNFQTSAGTPVINVSNGGALYSYFTTAGTQGFNKTGGGTLTYRYASTSTQPLAGNIILSGGSLGLNVDANLGVAANGIVISNNAQLYFNPTALAAVTLAATRSVTLACPAANFDVATTNYSLAIPGIINESAAGSGLQKNDVGTLILSGTNSYTGATKISGGTLGVSATNNLGAPAASLVFDGGTLQITGTVMTNFGHVVGFTSGKTVTLDINSAGNSFTADQPLAQGGGGLTKVGAGRLVLSSTNTYTGATIINAGTLALSGTGTINNTPSLTIAAGATYDVSSLNAYTLSGSTALIAGGNSANAVIQGAPAGTVALGVQPVTLNYDGTDPALVVAAGTLSLAGQTFTVNAAAPLADGTYNLVQVNSGGILHAGSYRVAGTATNGANGAAITFATNAGIACVQLLVSGATNTPIATATVLSGNETDYGTASAITATVSPGTATGSVQFFVDGQALGNPVALAGGVAAIPSTLGLASGLHTVSASYAGAGNYLPSTSASTVSLDLVNVAVASNEADAFELWLLHNQNQFPNDFYLAAPGSDASIAGYVAALGTNGIFLDITNYPPANSGYVMTENGSSTGWLIHLPRLTAIYAALINSNSSFYIGNNPSLITNLLPRLITATLAYTHVPWDITDEWGYCHTWADLCEGYAIGSVCLYSRQLNRLVPGLVPVSDIDAWGNRIPDLWRNGHIDTMYMTPANGSITTANLQFQVTGGNMVWTSQGIVLKYLTQSTNAVRLEGLDATFQHFWHGCSLMGAKHEGPPGWPAYTSLPQMTVDYMLGEHGTPYLLLYGGSYLNGLIQCRNDMANYPRWAMPPVLGINQLYADCMIQGVAPVNQGYPDRVLASRSMTSSTEYTPTYNLNSWLNNIIGYGYRTNELQALLTWNNNNNPGTNRWPFTNHTFTHFYSSDYSCQHYPNYLVTFRGASQRTCAIENLQNPLAGYYPQGRQIFVPLGGSYIYANGNEYGVVSYNSTGAAPFEASCDYTRIPGVTTKTVPDSAFTNYWRYVYGNLPFAGTAAANNSGVSGWEQSRNVRTDTWNSPISLSGHSAVFYLDMAVVHLGAGFDTTQDAYPTTTSLNQCLSASNTITYGLTNGTAFAIPGTGGGVTNAAISWALYQGVGYLPPAGGVKILRDVPQTTGAAASGARIFSFYADQSSPATNNLTFDWAVLPGISPTALAAYSTNGNRPWVIVTNTAALQALSVPAESWLGAVFHTNNATLFASNLTVSVSRPTVLIMVTSNQIATLYAADPYENMVAPYTNTIVPFTNSAQLVNQLTVTINSNPFTLTLPSYPYLGKTVVATVSISSSNYPPVIVSQPVSTNVILGNMAAFTAVAAGTPPPVYQWQRNGTNIAGANTVGYTLTPTLADNSASFRCVITNSAGAITSAPAVLSVNDTPSISTVLDQVLAKNTPSAPLPFWVNDTSVSPSSLIVTAASSNPTLIPNANLILGGSGTNSTLTVTPATNQTGYASINLSVSDGTLTASTAFFATVANYTNTLPPVCLPITNRTLVAGASLAMTSQATDPNVPALALGFALPTCPGGANINPASGVITWRPLIAQSGTNYPFMVVVTNTANLAATQSFYVNVIRPQAPLISSPAFSGKQFGFRISGDYGPDYTIQATTNLAPASWQIRFATNAPLVPFVWTETNTSLTPARFYRVLLGP